MDLAKLFTNSTNILRLRKGAMDCVTEAPLVQSVFMLATMSVLAALGYVLFPVRPFEGVTYRPDLLWVMGRALGNFIFYGLSFAFIGGVAEQLLKSKLDAREFFNIMAHASLAGYLLLVPTLFPAVLLWWLFIMHEALTKLGKLGVGSVVFLLCIQFLFSIMVGYHYFPFS